MKTILQFLFVIVCFSFTLCDVPGTLVGISRFASRVAPSCLNSFLSVCDGCKTLVKCQNIDPSPTFLCKDIYPDRPYCSAGVCTAEAPSGCESPFTCTDAGYYPNPLNCSRYHLCAGAAAIGTAVATYECPNGFVYNPLTTMCKLSTSSTDCATVDCSADPHGYAAYPADATFFASCTPNEEPLMLRCPMYYVYQPSSQQCVFHCPREGRIPHPTNKAWYYDCYLSGTIYYYRESKCVDGYEFDDKKQQCVKSAVTG